MNKQTYMRKVEDRFLKLFKENSNFLYLVADLKMKNGDILTIGRSGDYSISDCSGDSWHIAINGGKFGNWISYREMLEFIGYYGK